MNTISSLLKWIGNTIGANPSTLGTTSKTLVGAINEEYQSLTALQSSVTDVQDDVDTLKGYGVASFSGDTSVSLTSSDNNISLSLSSSTTDAGYSVSGSGVEVGSNGKYIISATWRFDSLGTTANTLTASIRKTSSGTTTTLEAFGSTHTGAYNIITASPKLYDLNENDVIYLSGRNNTASVGKLSSAYMTIQRVE